MITQLAGNSIGHYTRIPPSTVQNLLYAIPDDPALHPVGIYGDNMDGVTALNVAWTKRNIAQTETPIYVMSGIQFIVDAAGDYIYRTAPTGDFEAIASLTTAAVGASSLVGLGCVDSTTGTGLILASLSSSTYLWTVTSWTYPNDVNLGSTAGQPQCNITSGLEFFFRLKRAGNVWTGSFSQVGASWTSTSTTTMTINNPVLIVGQANIGTGGETILHNFNVYQPTYS